MKIIKITALIVCVHLLGGCNVFGPKDKDIPPEEFESLAIILQDLQYKIDIEERKVTEKTLEDLLKKINNAIVEIDKTNNTNTLKNRGSLRKSRAAIKVYKKTKHNNITRKDLIEGSSAENGHFVESTLDKLIRNDRITLIPGEYETVSKRVVNSNNNDETPEEYLATLQRIQKVTKPELPEVFAMESKRTKPEQTAEGRYDSPEIRKYDKVTNKENESKQKTPSITTNLYNYLTKKVNKVRNIYKDNEYMSVKGFSVEMGIPPSVTIDFEFRE